MRTCIACDYQNPDHTAFCLNCAAPLAANCPACGQAVKPDSKFCGQCGVRLEPEPTSNRLSEQPDDVRPNLQARLPAGQAEKIGAAAVKLVSERREVTVLSLAVTGLTAAGHKLDNEEMYLWLDEAMSRLAEVVYKYEGAIDKLSGNSLMAMFGAPIAHENDPERAIRAALDMQTAIRPLQTRIKQTHGFDFELRIGIDSGAVIAGRVGSHQHMEYTVAGDTVDAALHLERTAKPGTILVGAKTYQRSRSLFEFKMLPAMSVERAQSFELLGLLEKPAGRGASDLQSAMIGRGHDLARLQEALAVIQTQQRSRVVFVTGEAGLGKTRLVAEFRGALDATAISIYQGNCLDYGRSTPWRVVAALLRNILDLSEADSDEIQQQVVLAYLTRHNLVTDETLPYLLHVLGVAVTDKRLANRLQLLDAAMLQRQTHAALRQVFLAEARLKPTVLIFEDLHWIDPASKGFLEHLIQTSGEVSLLLILVSRESERETTMRPLLARANREPGRIVELSLQALSEAEGQLLVDQLINQTTSAAESVKTKIIGRAEGNPFFVEEIIQMLIDQGGLRRRQPTGTWQLTPQAAQLLDDLPGTIKGLLLARFDRLPESLRRKLQTAAVFGASFPVALFYLLDDAPPEAIAAQLGELEARQFLQAEPFGAEPGYGFRHALLQETIYGTLLKRDRRHLHTEVAQAIEGDITWPTDQHNQSLAYHYFEGTCPNKAVPYLLAAAENASRQCAYETAIEHYRKALPLIPDQPDYQDEKFFEVRLGLGRALKFVGELSAAGQLLAESLEQLWLWNAAAEQTQLGPILNECLSQLADIRQREGDYEQALVYLEAGLQVLGEAGAQEEPKQWRALLDRLAWVRFRQGQLEEAATLAHAATATLTTESVDDPIKLASLFNTLGGVSWQQGNLEKAVRYVERSLQLHQNVGYSWGQAVAYGNLGVLYDALGHWSQAVDYFKEAYALQQTIGDMQNQAVNLNNLGLLHVRMGDHEGAHNELEAALSVARQLGDPWSEAVCRINLADLSLALNDFEAAGGQVDEALSLAETIGSSEVQVQARGFLALVLAAKEDLQTALQMAEQALSMAQEAELSAEEANCYRVLGILNTQNGEYLPAEAFLQKSLTLALKQNDPYRQGLALLELGQVQQRLAGDDPPNSQQWQLKAMASFDEAAEKFGALGAVYHLRLAQSALSQILDGDKKNDYLTLRSLQ